MTGRMLRLTSALFALVTAFVSPLYPTLRAGAQGASQPTPPRPVHTFSIVARDPQTGELGVAVQSHWFSVARPCRGTKPASARSPRSRSSIPLTGA